ncbi:hypothetical protein ACQPZP_05540 [Spirillospora sp. CA-142024]|uniref:hypothetical protein n=1 Tax=Spirillospora sp. CA-142024 TaxID=3240036 RepID=UPI003D915DF1
MDALGPALVGGILASTSGISVPPPQDPIPPARNSWGYTLGAQDGGSPGSDGGKAVRDPQGTSRTADHSSQMGPHDCRTLSDNVQVCIPSHAHGGAAKPSPAELALTRWTRLPIPAPVVRTAPPRRAGGLVGLPEWFWVTNWRPLTARAAARGVWARMTARPQGMTIDPGYGERAVHCPGPGTAYDNSLPAASQHTRCSYTFTRSSLYQPGHAYRVRVQVVWGGTWIGSDGSSGVLPPTTRSTTLRLRIAEAQALYGRGRT